MIVLDSDLLVIDLRYPADARYGVNRQVLDALQLGSIPLAITCHTLLEVIGVVSFNSTSARTLDLPAKIPAWYAVEVLPDPSTHPLYGGCSIVDLVQRMARRCSLGDAVGMEQIMLFAPKATCFLSWNARYFQGQLGIPAITPEEWLRQQLAP